MSRPDDLPSVGPRNDRQCLSVVASQNNNFTTKWLIYLHRVPQRSVESLQMIAVGHWVLVPQDKLCFTNKFCRIGLRRIVARGCWFWIQGQMKATVSGTPTSQQCSSYTRLCNSKRHVALSPHLLQHRIEHKRLPTPSISMNKDSGRLSTLDAVQNMVRDNPLAVCEHFIMCISGGCLLTPIVTHLLS